MTRFILNVATEYEAENGSTKTKYTRGGAIFENTKKGSNEKVLIIKLDFPVGVTELVAFEPKAD